MLLLLPFLLSGTVHNRATRMPLRQAIISTSQAQTRSDDQGHYQLHLSLPARLVVRRLGFQPLDTLITTVPTIPLLLELTPLPTQLAQVGVTALRSPVSTHSSIDTSTIAAAMDVPALVAQTPSASFYSENGTNVGYSYIRLRGMDHNRINMTLDGVPVNEPEDQGAYFSNFPGFTGLVKSAQVQRGTGSSTFGSASYAGSINFESLDYSAPSSVSLTYGTNATVDQSLLFTIPGSWSLVTRFDRQHTAGYRHNSFYDGQSGYLALAHGSTRLVALAGNEHTGLSYLASPDSALRRDPRDNPLSPSERDHFSERLLYLTHQHYLGPLATSLTLFRTRLKGDYGVRLGDLFNFALQSHWTGITGQASTSPLGTALTTGFLVDSYRRDHAQGLSPLPDTIYHNNGHKSSASLWLKAASPHGPLTILAEAEARTTLFLYTPSANADIVPQSKRWTFFNPKAGAIFARGLWTISSSLSKTSREPTRNDMFAGFDNLDTSNVAIAGVGLIRPEHVRDLETTLSYLGPLRVSLTAFRMNFKDEIAPIGSLSYIGLPLRKNVTSSLRQGLEGTAAIDVHGLKASSSATVMRGMYQAYTNDATHTVYHQVSPLLTPRLNITSHLSYTSGNWSMAYQDHYTSKSYLDNSEDSRLVLPPAYIASLGLATHRAPLDIAISANNIFNRRAYQSGTTDGLTSSYYPYATRNMSVTTTLHF